jgi:hypothetical protein
LFKHDLTPFESGRSGFDTYIVRLLVTPIYDKGGVTTVLPLARGMPLLRSLPSHKLLIESRHVIKEKVA